MLKKKYEKVLAAALSCTMMVSMLAGCGSDTVAEAPESEAVVEAEESVSAAKPEEKETAESVAEEVFDAKAVCEGVTLTVAVPEKTRIADWDENDQTKLIEETLGVNLEFEVYPSADFTSKINAMVMAGDELPDIIMQVDETYNNWAAEGALLELSEYYEDPNLAANIMHASEGAGYDIGSYMKNGEGEIYALPRLEQGYGMQAWQRLWIYKPWLDQLGKDIPKTIDEFYEICKLVKENDMNGNGDTTDEVVIAGDGFNKASDYGWSDWFEPLMSAFVYAYDPNFFVVKDGQVSLAYTSEEWKEGLTYIKKFFDEGLIGSEIFTNTSEDTKATMYTELPTALSFTGWAYEGPDNSICIDYTYVTGLTNADGENGASMYMPILPSAGAVISADCENPEAAFLVCDFLCSEYVSLMTRYGKEGENWVYWDQLVDEGEFNPDDFVAQGGGEIEWLSSYKDTTFWSSQETTTSSWLQTGPFIRNAALQSVRARQISAETEEEKLKIACTSLDFESKDAGVSNAEAEVFDYAPLTNEEMEAVADVKITAMNYVSEMTAAFLTGSRDIEAEWDAYLAELEKIGVYDMLEIYQEAYSRVH